MKLMPIRETEAITRINTEAIRQLLPATALAIDVARDLFYAVARHYHAMPGSVAMPSSLCQAMLALRTAWQGGNLAELSKRLSVAVACVGEAAKASLLLEDMAVLSQYSEAQRLLKYALA